MIVSLLVFVVGLMNIVSSLGRGIPVRLRFLESVIPIEVSNLSRTLNLVIGFFLLMLAYGLWQRKRRAWLMSIILLGVSFVLHLFRGLNLEEELVIFGSLSILLAAKKDFWVESSRSSFWSALMRSVVIMLALFVYAVFGYFLFDRQFSNEVSLVNIQNDYLFSIFGTGKDTLIPLTRQARWFQDSISVVGWIGIVTSLLSLFSPVSPGGGLDREKRRWLYNLVKGYGRGFLSYFALAEDKKIFFSSDKKVAIAYKISGSTTVVLGSPLGVRESWGEAVGEFKNFCASGGLNIVFYGLSSEEKEFLRLALKDWSGISIGEWAVVELSSFDLKSSKLSELRHGVSRFEREGLEVLIYKLAEVPWNILQEVTKLREEWLSRKKIPRISFSNDFFPLPVENDGYLVVAKSKVGVQAALSFFPSGNSLVLDMMVRRQDLLNGLMDGLMASCLVEFKKRGFEEVCLGMVARRFKRLRFFRSLRKFKTKFNPRWEKAYVVYKNKMKFPQVILALVGVHLS